MGHVFEGSRLCIPYPAPVWAWRPVLSFPWRHKGHINQLEFGAFLVYLRFLLKKWIDELPIAPGERALYDPQELAGNLLDWMDGNEVRAQGGFEDDFYQAQDPPYQAANGPLLSVEELRLVEGFDGTLVDHLRNYVTVFPWSPGGCGRPGWAEWGI